MAITLPLSFLVISIGFCLPLHLVFVVNPDLIRSLLDVTENVKNPVVKNVLSATLTPLNISNVRLANPNSLPRALLTRNLRALTRTNTLQCIGFLAHSSTVIPTGFAGQTMSAITYGGGDVNEGSNGIPLNWVLCFWPEFGANLGLSRHLSAAQGTTRRELSYTNVATKSVRQVLDLGQNGPASCSISSRVPRREELGVGPRQAFEDHGSPEKTLLTQDCSACQAKIWLARHLPCEVKQKPMLFVAKQFALSRISKFRSFSDGSSPSRSIFDMTQLDLNDRWLKFICVTSQDRPCASESRT
ncbi:hypothetical protein R3P38DRAFT_2803676 [Favolaschia claudopus]|uniref:Uncharacterized protein n=1 Tax=Favolaschia claudopus TaxID=2862362 RepID=A0AAV9ZT04_9AGAR